MRGDEIILVHGLIRSRASMLVASAYLKHRGYYVVSFPYRSTKRSIDDHAAALADFIAEFAERSSGRRIHFVTHSLGGILLRIAVDSLIRAGRINGERFGRAVMFAPPNQGSAAATRIAKSKLISDAVKPLRELRDVPGSRARTAPIPNILEYGVITGRWDGKVSPKEARLGCERDFMVCNSFHTFLMNRPDLLKAAARFIETGSFNPQKG